jgi:hypothetical protein
VVLCVAAALAVVPAAWKRLRRRAAVTEPATTASPMLEIVGEPEDWTDKSRVLGEIPDRLRCAVPLPDHRTIRIVWGRPPRAEDLDTKTGQRVPSPVVSAAYAEGCPDLSPDGKRLLYQGHMPDGRAFAFVAENPEGRHAAPVVATAEPTHLSEPRWLPDGRTLSYDIDMRNVGVFSLETNRSTVVGTVGDGASGASFRWTSGNVLFLGEMWRGNETEFLGFEANSWREFVRFRVPAPAMDLVVAGPGKYLGVIVGTGIAQGAYEAVPSRRIARRIGFIPGQEMARLARVDDGWFFTSRRETTVVTLPARDGRPSDSFKVSPSIQAISDCGDEFLTIDTEGGAYRVIRRTRKGGMIRYSTDGPMDYGVSCSRDGRWFYLKASDGKGTVVGCGPDGCTDLLKGNFWRIRVSPDGSRLAVLSLEKRGPTVSWIELREPANVHFLRETETTCCPTWSSNGAIWITSREGAATVWIEVDIRSGKDTGRRQRGSTNCSDGTEEPNPPGEPEAKFTSTFRTQLRVIAQDVLGL